MGNRSSSPRKPKRPKEETPIINNNREIDENDDGQFVKVRVGSDYLKVDHSGRDTLHPVLNQLEADATFVFNLANDGLLRLTEDGVDGTYVHGAYESARRYLTKILTAERCGRSFILRAVNQDFTRGPDAVFVPQSASSSSYSSSSSLTSSSFSSSALHSSLSSSSSSASSSSSSSSEDDLSTRWIARREAGDWFIFESCLCRGYCLAADEDREGGLCLERISMSRARGRMVTFYVMPKEKAQSLRCLKSSL
jgi:hypothetical protein